MATVPGTNKEDHDASREELVDEFTFPGNRQELLQESRTRIQTLFPVIFTVLESVDSFCYDHKGGQKVPERIWVQLKGKQEAVHNAKEYIKGLCEPEISTSELYPKEMHCIFVGAHGCFLRSLIRDTCANISMLEIGALAIRGGTEPVVMAQSKIQQLVKIFTDNASLAPGKEPEVKRRFKFFVEAHADKYTMDLLLLPSALKEELLILIGNDDDSLAQTDAEVEHVTLNCNDNQHKGSEDEVRTKTPVTELMCQLDSVLPGVPQSHSSHSFTQQEKLKVKRRGSEKENECRKKPYSLEKVQTDGPVISIADSSDASIIDLVSTDSDDQDIIILDPISAETEYKILVNFFKTMGYPEEVVVKVIRDLGQSEEPLKLLDEIDKRSKTSLAVDNSNPKGQSHPQQEVLIEPNVLPTSSRALPLQKPSTVMAREESISNRLEEEINLPKNVGFVARGTASPPIKRRMPTFNAQGPPIQPNARVAAEIPVKSNNTAHTDLPFIDEWRHAANGRQGNAESSVTGVQIFLNSIKTPYRLELKNEAGRGDLKHIIIDGSNVAMRHGLQHFFSCRGIAIAVEHFWRRGHRKITVFVPQWRTKRDPNITEQHFLQELEELGILSFTPARTVLGSRIASHDDRFLLHLAEKTEGIIVTNDNLREFVGESPAWRQIIKERILQFTFVGDILMLPDDPLGRYGPKLDIFLSTHPKHRNMPAISPPDSGVHFPSQNPPLIRPTVRNDRMPLPQFHPRQGTAALRNMPQIPPPDSGVRFPSQDHPLLIRAAARHERLPLPVFHPRQGTSALQNMPRPRAQAPPQRTFHETLFLRSELLKIFPETEQMEKINQILTAHPYMRDLNALSAMILD